MFFIDGTIHNGGQQESISLQLLSVAPHDGDSSKLWPASTRSSCVHREVALSRSSRCFKAGASERSPPLWSGINAALTLLGNADRFMREAHTGKEGGLGRPGRSDAGVVVVLVLNHFRCSTGSLQNYSIIALNFLRNCGKKRYSTARFPSPSSSTARAHPWEVTDQKDA